MLAGCIDFTVSIKTGARADNALRKTVQSIEQRAKFVNTNHCGQTGHLIG